MGYFIVVIIFYRVSSGGFWGFWCEFGGEDFNFGGEEERGDWDIRVI